MNRETLPRALVAAIMIVMSGNAYAAATKPMAVIGQLVLNGGAASPVMSYAWSVTADTKWTQGGASVGKPNPDSIRITRQFDSSSIEALLKIASGQAFVTGVLTVTVGKGKSASTMVYEMVGLFVTNITHGVEEGLVSESISFVFKTVKWTLTDAAGNVTTGQWDIPAGTAS